MLYREAGEDWCAKMIDRINEEHRQELIRKDQQP